MLGPILRGNSEKAGKLFRITITILKKIFREADFEGVQERRSMKGQGLHERKEPLNTLFCCKT